MHEIWLFSRTWFVLFIVPVHFVLYRIVESYQSFHSPTIHIPPNEQTKYKLTPPIHPCLPTNQPTNLSKYLVSSRNLSPPKKKRNERSFQSPSRIKRNRLFPINLYIHEAKVLPTSQFPPPKPPPLFPLRSPPSFRTRTNRLRPALTDQRPGAIVELTTRRPDAVARASGREVGRDAAVFVVAIRGR